MEGSASRWSATPLGDGDGDGDGDGYGDGDGEGEGEGEGDGEGDGEGRTLVCDVSRRISAAAAPTALLDSEVKNAGGSTGTPPGLDKVVPNGFEAAVEGFEAAVEGFEAETEGVDSGGGADADAAGTGPVGTGPVGSGDGF